MAMSELGNTHSLRLAADLEVVRDALFVTGRYQDFRPELGVGVRTTLGGPEKYGWWRNRARLVMPKPWAVPPWREFRIEDATEGEAAYCTRLDGESDRVIHQLADLATQFPGRRLVLLCYEDVHRGEVCHRRWFADWMWSRWQIEIPELPDPRPDPYGGC
jgi:hypothetical protein